MRRPFLRCPSLERGRKGCSRSGRHSASGPCRPWPSNGRSFEAPGRCSCCCSGISSRSSPLLPSPSKDGRRRRFFFCFFCSDYGRAAARSLIICGSSVPRWPDRGPEPRIVYGSDGACTRGGSRSGARTPEISLFIVWASFLSRNMRGIRTSSWGTSSLGFSVFALALAKVVRRVLKQRTNVTEKKNTRRIGFCGLPDV